MSNSLPKLGDTLDAQLRAYLKEALAACQDCERLLREKIGRLIAIEKRNVELRCAQIEQALAQKQEYDALLARIEAVEVKSKAMRKPNAYTIPSSRDLLSYLEEAGRTYAGFLQRHGHGISEPKGAENAYHMDWRHSTWDALQLPPGCGSFPRSVRDIR